MTTPTRPSVKPDWTHAYHVRSAAGVSLEFTSDLAAARSIARANSASLYHVTRATGVATRIG